MRREQDPNQPVLAPKIKEQADRQQEQVGGPPPKARMPAPMDGQEQQVIRGQNERQIEEQEYRGTEDHEMLPGSDALFYRSQLGLARTTLALIITLPTAVTASSCFST